MTATSDRLAAVLSEAGLDEMATKARQGFYDDYKSPLAFPLTQLYGELLGLGRKDLAERVADGEFDSTKEESAAWAQSPDGQATFAELVGGMKNRAQRRADEKRRRKDR